METASPPVSPSVVAAILMIQKINVTSGTLLKPWSALEFINFPGNLLGYCPGTKYPVKIKSDLKDQRRLQIGVDKRRQLRFGQRANPGSHNLSALEQHQ